MLYLFARTKLIIYLVLILTITGINITISNAAIMPVAIVKFYSDGKLITKWESIDKGRVDGKCYVFHISKGASRPEIRVCGTYSVEQIR